MPRRQPVKVTHASVKGVGLLFHTNRLLFCFNQGLHWKLPSVKSCKGGVLTYVYRRGQRLTSKYAVRQICTDKAGMAATRGFVSDPNPSQPNMIPIGNPRKPGGLIFNTSGVFVVL